MRDDQLASLLAALQHQRPQPTTSGNLKVGMGVGGAVIVVWLLTNGFINTKEGNLGIIRQELEPIKLELRQLSDQLLTRYAQKTELDEVRKMAEANQRELTLRTYWMQQVQQENTKTPLPPTHKTYR